MFGIDAEEQSTTEKEPIGSASIRLMGSLGRMKDGNKLSSQTVKTPIRISDLLKYLQGLFGIDFRIDSTLVIVNGVESRALNDVETVVQSGDEVVILPMFHGG